MNPENTPGAPRPNKVLNAIVYIVIGAIVGGFAAAAVPALNNNAAGALHAGLIGVGVGALAGLVIGLIKRFA